MVPVELRLSNFMSYGPEAPVLDFEQFHVACLSGGNGQGKSALLDAITWALWGEARKSSDSRKPDDELIRLGARRMKVELVFDVEGRRYRVARAYTRSASGKTSKPELELHVHDEAAGAFRPLTAGAVRDTQNRLNALLGLDYDTFINSAFLLQGRSDEFTKKKPSERKQILGRILNLERYDRLAELAREREREAQARLHLAEQAMGRLRESLAREAEWQAALDEAEAASRAEEARLAAHRADEQQARDALTTLDGLRQQAEGLRRAQQATREQAAQFEQDVATLTQRLGEAAHLLGQRAQIERDFERHLALQAERNALDQQRDLHRGVEIQIEQKERERHNKQAALQKELHEASTTLQLKNDRLQAYAAQLAEEPSLRRRLEKAREAEERLKTLEGVLAERRRLEARAEAMRRAVATQRDRLQGEVDMLAKELPSEREALGRREDLMAQQKRLQADLDLYDKTRQEADEVREKGLAVNAQIESLTARLNTLAVQREERLKSLARIQTVEVDTCPTCGTDLTPEHRAHVAETYQREIDQLQRSLDEMERERKRLFEERDSLRRAYAPLGETLKQHAEAAARLAALRQRLSLYDAAAQRLAERAERLEALRRRLAGDDYAHEERAGLAEAEEALRALPLDETELMQARIDAAERPRLAATIIELEQVRGAHDVLQQEVARLTEQEHALRADLTEGRSLRSLLDDIERLRAELAGIGFKSERLDEVKRQLKDLEAAPQRYQALANAAENKTRWEASRAQAEARLAQCSATLADQQAQLDAFEVRLRDRPALEARYAEAVAARQGVEACLHTLRTRLGALQAQLEQVARDKASLKAEQEVVREAEAERHLYGHLRTAFGRNGIPSLIIEQTLPEIEDRANDLLERLTEGRMHVRFDTIKDMKTGGTKETLDIIITDEQGAPRAYEMFSGGEAFRVNFALRIALAQILAERSGVQIRTLVVDEGFGTQDVQGVQSMVEAIQAIQHDFDKIMVITHLDQLKEAFPVRIEVEKDPVHGSRFEVLGV